MTIKCDVLIVGGGPAGLSASILLSKRGFSSVIVEKSHSFGYSSIKYDITEGNIMENITKELGIKPDKICRKSEWISSHHSFMIESDVEDFYFKRGDAKNSLENKLVRKIDKENVKLFLGTQVKSFKLEDENFTETYVKTPEGDERISSRYVIIANGPNTYFKKLLGVDYEILVRFRGFGILAESSEDNLFPHAKIYFDHDLAPGGYIYVGSVNRDVFSCVVIDEFFNSTDIENNSNRFFMEKMQGKLRVRNYFSGIGLSGIMNPVKRNALFIGSSALFHDPIFGYGLNYAIESAYFAVKAIDEDDLGIYFDYGKRTQDMFRKLKLVRDAWRGTSKQSLEELISVLDSQLLDDLDGDVIRMLTLLIEKND